MGKEDRLRREGIRVGILIGVTAWIMVLGIIVVMVLFMPDNDHTHPTTGIQFETDVCVAGEAAIDYDIATTRPFIVCGKISSMGTEESPPPLGSDTHLVQ